MILPYRVENLDPAQLKLPDNFSPDRERLSAILLSIKEQGLLHPPCVKDTGEVFAGRMRVLACKELKLEQIECHVYPSTLDEDEYKVYSLHENLKRFNLDWSNQVICEKELHELRIAQNGQGKKGKKVGWSLRDTAAELQMAFGTLSEDIKLAEAVTADPQLARIKDKATARRVILSQIKRNEQQKVSQVNPSGAAYNCCLHGGSEVILQQYPDEFFDACITDPPWIEFKDKSLIRDQYTLPVFKEVFRTLKMNSFLYAFVGMQDWIFYHEELPKIGFNVQKWPLIWAKEGSISRGCLSWQHQRDFELIILAVKGSPALTSSMLSSVMSCKVVPGFQLVHPNEKPKAIINRLIEACTFENATVLDPFAGSFVVGAVCKELRRNYVCIENNAEFYQKGVERLK